MITEDAIAVFAVVVAFFAIWNLLACAPIKVAEWDGCARIVVGGSVLRGCDCSDLTVDGEPASCPAPISNNADPAEVARAFAPIVGAIVNALR